MPEFQPLCQFVTAALPSGKDVPAESALQKKMSTCWRKHAGNATMHSQPLLFASGRVVAFVESATWGNEIRHHAEHLRQALIADGIPVTGVEVKIMPLSPPRPRPSRARAVLSPKSAKRISQLAQTISYPELKASLLRLAKQGKP